MVIPKQSLTLCLHLDHKIVVTDEGREQRFCAVLTVTDFHYKVLPRVWESGGRTDRLENAASQSPSAWRSPLWKACQFRVETGFVQEVEGSSVEPDKRWGADVNPRESIQGSSSECYKASLFLPPFIYPQVPLVLLCYRHFSFAQHFLAVSFSLVLLLYSSCIMEKNRVLFLTLQNVDVNAIIPGRFDLLNRP